MQSCISSSLAPKTNNNDWALVSKVEWYACDYRLQTAEACKLIFLLFDLGMVSV